MNPYFGMMQNPMANLARVMQQVQQIKQNPSQLGSLLKSRGIITEQQASEISQMGSNYEQVGQYLMSNGVMPQPTQEVINRAQQASQIPPNQA